MANEDKMDWRRRAAELTFEDRPFIDGDFRLTKSDRRFETENPATKQALATFGDGTADDIDDAVSSARKAFTATWRGMSPVNRKTILLRLAETIRRHKEDLALFDTVEMGKPISMSLGEAAAAADFVQYYAELADKIVGEVASTDHAHTLGLTYQEPRGVVGVITPWNFPMLTAVSAVAPALAAGNAVVLKPSEQSPSSALKLAALASEAGIPDGVLNVVAGTGASAGAALAMHNDVDKLHFTGSTAVGKQLMVYAGQSNAKPVMLETGGKSPQIVFQDAVDVEGVGEALAAAVFSNSGQICVARTKLIVHESIVDEIVERIATGAKAVFKAGDTLDERVSYGPICSKRQFDRVQSFLETGKQEGAVSADLPLDSFGKTPGYFVTPTLMTNVTTEMRIVREEIFGPVLSILSFATEAEALALANNSEYGLAATVWTRDVDRARRFARDVEAGRIDIRTFGGGGASLAHLTAEPFGASGHGPLGGVKGLAPYLRQKGVQIITN